MPHVKNSDMINESHDRIFGRFVNYFANVGAGSNRSKASHEG